MTTERTTGTDGGLDLALALVRLLDGDIARAFTLARPYDRARALDTIRSQVRALAHTLECLDDQEFARLFARELARTRERARTLGYTRALNHDRVNVRARDLIRDLNGLALNVEALVGPIDDLGPVLEHAERNADVADADVAPRLVSARTAENLIRFQMRLLPVQHRGRFAEEFRAELCELTQAKATRSMQVLYAVQQLRRVWHLRAALQAPGRPLFFRLHRAACWMLSSNLRTWAPLFALLLWGGLETVTDTGLGAAISFVVLGGVGYAACVQALRNRWNVEVKKRKTSVE